MNASEHTNVTKPARYKNKQTTQTTTNQATQDNDAEYRFFQHACTHAISILGGKWQQVMHYVY